jgi:hypothetical protein
MLLAGLFQQEVWQQLNQGNYAVIITHKQLNQVSHNREPSQIALFSVSNEHQEQGAKARNGRLLQV